MSRRITATETAKIIRKTLKREFATAKFSVRKTRGGSIRISWVDGPTKSQVSTHVGHMYSCEFDGMQDLKTYHDTQLNGETVHFGNDFLFFDRNYSEGFLHQVIDQLADEYGLVKPLVEVFPSSGHAYMSTDGGRISGSTGPHWTMRCMAQRAAQETEAK